MYSPKVLEHLTVTQTLEVPFENFGAAALLCGFSSVEEFLEWAEPHIVRGEN